MARKEKIINVIDGGVSKSFKIRQFSASQGERVKFKMMLLLGADTDISKLQSNDDNPTALASTMLNAVANKPYEKVQELLDEVLSCISVVTDGGIETQLTPELVDGFIDESATLTKLRGEVIKFNNFFPQNGSSDSNESPAPSVTIKRQK